MNFLDKLQNHILSEHKDCLENIVIIFPGKRAGIYFKNNLIKKHNGILPTIYSIEEFYEEFTQIIKPSKNELIEILYASFLSIRKNPVPFLEFTSIATTVLNDFDELDRELVNTDDAFQLIEAEKKIHEWNPGQSEFTTNQEKYLRFWAELQPLYHSFNKNLQAKNKGYNGLQERFAIENFNDCLLQFLQNNETKKIVFAGFNALTKAEVALIKQLYKTNQCDFYWDLDSFYTTKPFHEAGYFFRKLKSELIHSKNWIFDKIDSSAKEYNTIKCGSNISQLVAISQIIKTIEKDKKIGIVLADEILLIQLLNELDTVHSANISIGIPIFQSEIFQFFKLFIHCLNELHHKKNLDIKILIQLLSFRIIGLHNINNQIRFELFESWKKENKTSISLTEILSLSSKASFFKLFTLQKEFSKTIHSLIAFLDKAQISHSNSLNRFESLSILKIKEVLQEINQHLITYNIKISDFEKAFEYFSKSESIHIKGSKDSNIQIVGILETRNLNFDQVFILSLNEGVLPKPHFRKSFLPNYMRSHFGLLSNSGFDAVISYHFYSLLQNCKAATFLYVESENGIDKSEKSRYLLQLENELKKAKFSVKYLHNDFKESFTKPLEIKNNESIKRKTISYLQNGISASAINNYLNDPYSFYRQNINKIYEPSEIEYEMEASTFGDITHNSLEAFYKPFVNQLLTPEILLRRIKKIDSIVENEFLKQFTKEQIKSGTNMLYLNSIKKIVTKFLTSDIQFFKNEFKSGKECRILGLEMSLKIEINESLPYNLKGTIDRIDQIGNTIRIIDYKTGIVKPAELKIISNENYFQLENFKIIQLLIYLLLYEKSKKIDYQYIKLGMISLRESYNLIELNYGKNNLYEIKNKFKKELNQFVQKLNDSPYFIHNEEAEYPII